MNAEVRRIREQVVDVTDPDDFPMMAELREFAAANRERIDAEWAAAPCPPMTIAEHVASLSPERRAELDQEWI
jgi:hypothetical protein